VWSDESYAALQQARLLTLAGDPQSAVRLVKSHGLAEQSAEDAWFIEHSASSNPSTWTAESAAFHEAKMQNKQQSIWALLSAACLLPFLLMSGIVWARMSRNLRELDVWLSDVAKGEKEATPDPLKRTQRDKPDAEKAPGPRLSR